MTVITLTDSKFVLHKKLWLAGALIVFMLSPLPFRYCTLDCIIDVSDTVSVLVMKFAVVALLFLILSCISCSEQETNCFSIVEVCRTLCV